MRGLSHEKQGQEETKKNKKLNLIQMQIAKQEAAKSKVGVTKDVLNKFEALQKTVKM